jgi:nitrate/nitrite transport system ATP-binding protein
MNDPQPVLAPEYPSISTNEYLSIRDVVKSFDTAAGHMIALRDINLDVKRGEFISFIGHSGCGKSTLLNIVAGLSRQTSGEVMLNGRPILGPGPDRGVVFQNYSLLPWLSVRENVFEAVDAVYKTMTRPEKHALVDDFLNKVGLAEHRDKRPSQISGGMKQRVAIARAFATHPEVMLLDEPFGALDALTRNSLQEELLQMWAGENQTETVIMVTHDIDEAIYLSDRIVVMTNGPEATIGEIIEVDLPRPRTKQALIHLPQWTGIKDRLLYLLTVAYAHTAKE